MLTSSLLVRFLLTDLLKWVGKNKIKQIPLHESDAFWKDSYAVTEIKMQGPLKEDNPAAPGPTVNICG